jgi:glutamate carboxypeptidase
MRSTSVPAPAETSHSSSVAARVRTRLESQREGMTELLGQLVNIETPSDDAECLNRMADRLEQLFERFGAVTRHRIGANGASHLVVNVDGADDSLPPALVIGHFDTVWPRGTIERLPFDIDADGIATGPGCFDMKGGLVLLLFALAALTAIGRQPRRPLRVLLDCDEEIGSPTARDLIDTMASQAGVGLVLEPPLPGGVLKTARKGSLLYRLEIIGRAAHAGIEPEKGASAILELARQIEAINALHDPERGTLVNIGVVRGGSRLNVVPAQAEADIAVRVTTADDADRVDRAMKTLSPSVPGTEVRVIPGRTRPPMQPSPASGELFARARVIAASAGIADLTDGATGGGSDANLVAARGVPTLDGLGPEGDGAHADHEHVVLASMPARAALIAGLLAEA